MMGQVTALSCASTDVYSMPGLLRLQTATMPPPSKRRKVSPPPEPAAAHSGVPDADTNTFLGSSFSKNAAQWDLEQDYEQGPRKQKNAKENLRLPIKTAEGLLEQPVVPVQDDQESVSSFGSLEDDTPLTDHSDGEDAVVEDKSVPVKEQILQAQEELAKAADLINENPEEHISSLRVLANITGSKIPTIAQYGMVTQMRVYQDIIPGYRIRPLSAEDMGPKVSKDVRKLRAFEQAIVKGYQAYVQELARTTNSGKNDRSQATSGLVETAVSCACVLINAVPHFNFRSELLKIAVAKLSKRQIDSAFTQSHDCLEKLFADDEEGNASLEAVSMLCKMIKSKHYQIDETVLNLFLSLRLLSEFSQKGSQNKIDKPPDGEAQRLKKSKQKREFRTKRERKIAKANKAIRNEMKEAEAVVTHEERDQKQGEMLKLVFGTYFRILKERIPNLMGAVLEGLVKYAHLINQDFFGDLLESLRELVAEAEEQAKTDENGPGSVPNEQSGHSASRNTTRESLLCVTTAFGLLQGQDATAAASTLHLDLDFFINHLYRTLHPLALNPDLEMSSRTPRVLDPDSATATPKSRTKVNVSTLIVLLLRSLSSVLLPPHATHSVPPTRLAAFSKQILTSSLHMPEKSCTAMLGLMNQTARTHGKKIGPLWRTEERRGDGVFDGARGVVERSNPFAGTVWEGELLRLHFAPSVREGARNLEGIVGAG